MIKHTLQSGAAMLLFVLFFAFAASMMLFTLNQSIFIDLFDYNQLTRAKQATLVAESSIDDVAYRLVFGTFDTDALENLTLDGVTASS